MKKKKPIRKFILTVIVIGIILYAIVKIFSHQMIGHHLHDHEKSSEKMPEIVYVQDQVDDTLIVTPDKVIVSELKKSFTLFPDFQGEECATVEYYIGLKIEEALYQVKKYEMFFTKKSEVKKDNRPSRTELMYSKLAKTPAEDLFVIIINNEVMKIATREKWSDNNRYEPSFVFFQKEY